MSDETEQAAYMLPHMGVVVTFDGFTWQFTPTRRDFDDLQTPMQTEILRALLNGALQLIERGPDDRRTN